MPDVSTKHCPYCQAICDEHDTFCGKCGQPFIASTWHTVTNDSEQSRTIEQHPSFPPGSVAPLNQAPPSGTLPAPNPNSTFSTIPSSSTVPTSNTAPAGSPVLSPLPFPTPPPPQRQRPTKYLVIIAVLLILLAGGAGIEIGRWSNTVFPSPSATGKTATSQPTTRTQPRPGEVLYQEDGSDKWKGWEGSADWSVLDGTLINDGTYDMSSEPPTITAPYQVQGSANYAVEAKIRVLRQTKRQNTPYFGISVRGTYTAGSWQGYWASVIMPNSYVKESDVYIQDNNSNNFLQSILINTPFDPGEDWHTYRVEVNGNDIKVLIDGLLALETQDNRFLTGGQIGFGTVDTELVISNFKIVAL